MDKFTPYDKLSKKEQKKRDAEGEPPLADSQVTDYVPLVYGTVAHIFR